MVARRRGAVLSDLPAECLSCRQRILPKLLVALLVLCPIGRAISYSTGDEMGYYVLMRCERHSRGRSADCVLEY